MIQSMKSKHDVRAYLRRRPPGGRTLEVPGLAQPIGRTPCSFICPSNRCHEEGVFLVAGTNAGVRVMSHSPHAVLPDGDRLIAMCGNCFSPYRVSLRRLNEVLAASPEPVTVELLSYRVLRSRLPEIVNTCRICGSRFRDSFGCDECEECETELAGAI